MRQKKYRSKQHIKAWDMCPRIARSTDHGRYRLGHKNRPVPVNNLIRWALEYEKHRVLRQTWVQGVKISTIFMGLDHSFMGRKPLVFETMIFGGEHDLKQFRYTTYKQAISGHARAVRLVKYSNNPKMYATVEAAQKKLRPGQVVAAWGTTGYYVILSRKNAEEATRLINLRIIEVPNEKTRDQGKMS